MTQKRQWIIWINETPKLLIEYAGNKHDKDIFYCANGDYYITIEDDYKVITNEEFLREMKFSFERITEVSNPSHDYNKVIEEELTKESYQDVYHGNYNNSILKGVIQSVFETH